MRFRFDDAGEIAAWTLGATNSEILAEPTAPSPPNVLSLGIEGFASRTLTGLTAGQTYPFYLRCNFDDVDNVARSGVLVKYNNSTKFVFGKDENEIGWNLRYLGTLVYTPANRALRFETATEWDAGRVLIDDIYIGEVPWELQDMPRKWDAVSGSVDVLKTINGATGNFNNDLGGRVHTRLFTATEQPTVKRPFVCLPLEQEAEAITYEGQMFQSTWRLHGQAFFDDNINNDKLDSSGATAAARFRDDLIRAFMLNPNLSRAALAAEVVEVDTDAGVVDDGVSEVRFTIELTQYGSAADLAAT